MQKTLENIRYWTYGDAKNPTVILVHGFTGSHEGFQYIVPKLSNFHVMVPDLPGFGRSELPAEPWTMSRIASLTNRFVQALQLHEPPFLVSHSMGSLIAAEMLKENPSLYATKTMFISPVAAKITWNDSRILGALATRLHYAAGKHLPHVGPKLVKSKRFSTFTTRLMRTTKNPELRKAIDAHHHGNLEYISSIEYYHALHKDIIGKGLADYTTTLNRFNTLIVSGNRDNVTPLRTIKALRRQQNFELVTLEGVGHLAHYEKPDEIASALILFLG